MQLRVLPLIGIPECAAAMMGRWSADASQRVDVAGVRLRAECYDSTSI
jgi:hypothetical protein